MTPSATDQIQKLSPVISFTTTFDYDAEGNLSATIDPKSQTINHSYDELNRLTTSSYPGNSSPYLTLTNSSREYDANNNITKITETKSAADNVTVIDITENSYDNFDRLQKSIQRGESGITLDYLYDNNGNRTSVTTGSGASVTSASGYTFDERNRLQTANASTTSTPLSTGPLSASTNYCYRQDSRKELTSYPNGASEQLSYDPATNRITSIINKGANNSIISSYAYEYDQNGNRTKQLELQTKTDGTTITGITAYAKLDPPTSGYDQQDRLISYTVTTGGAGTTTDYTFDGYNRKTETVTENPATTVTTDTSVITISKALNKVYSYNSLNQLQSLTENSTITTTTVDSATGDTNTTTSTNGNRTISYDYDNNGNTTKKSDSALDPAVADTIFDYDSLNRLVQAKAAGSVLGQYDYDDNNLRIRHRYSERGDINYYYDGRSVIEEHNASDNSLLARYSYADKLLSMTTPNGSQYYHHDALGSTVNLTNEAGSMQAGYIINPYGLILQKFGESANRKVFTGKEIDERTGLIDFGARLYDPEIARFITQDSYLGESSTPPSLHRYLYAYSNPTVFIDLEGYASDEVSAWGRLWNGGKEFLKAVPVATKGMFSGFDKALDNAYQSALDNKLPLMNNDVTRAGITAGVTFTKAILGMGALPLVKTSQAIEYGSDPKKVENFPIYGTGVRDTYHASEAFAKDSSLENGLQVVQAAAGTFLEAVGVTYGAKAVANMRGTAPKSGITAESYNSQNFVGPLSPSQLAKSSQGSGAYTGVDTYVDTTFNKGTFVVGAAPGQTPFYTTLDGFERTGGTAEGYYQGLQIQPNLTNPAYPTYRNGVTVYKVNADSTQAATGTAQANPQFGPGGVPQVFIPNHNNALTPVYSIPFKAK